MNTFLHTTAGKRHLRLDPRTKCALILCTSFTLVWGASLVGVMAWVRPALALVPAILLLFTPRWRIGIVYGILEIVCFVLEFTVFKSTTGFWNLILLPVCAILTRFMPCVIAAYYMMATTTVSEFTAGMERMHVTQKLVIPLSVMFRFFPTIAKEQQCISDAMRMRNITASNPVAMLEYRIVPLIATIAKIGDELSAAALTRGLGGDVKRSNVCEIGFGIQDIIILLLSFGGAFLFLLVRLKLI